MPIGSYGGSYGDVAYGGGAPSPTYRTVAPGGGNWDSASTWVEGLVPTAADDVVLNNASGNLTINVAAACRSFDCDGSTGRFAGTVTHNAGIALSIGDGVTGAGGVALRLSPTMTYTLGNAATSAISFVSTSAAQQRITAAGKTLGSWTVNGAGASYLLADANTAGSAATVTLTTGTLDTGGQTCSWGVFNVSGTGVRTITLGSSSITCTVNGTGWSAGVTTNLTVSANTAVVTLSGATSQFNTSSFNWNGLSLVFTGSGSASIGAGSATFANLTRTGTAVKTDSFTLNASQTVTGTLTIAGNSAVNRLLVQSNILGTARTITAAVVVASNVDLMDITGAGAGSWNLAAITGLSGDCGGNSGVTFTTAAAQTHTASAGGNWSDATKWTSRVPLPQDNVVVDAITTGTLTVDMPRIGKDSDFTGFAGALSFSSAPTCFGGVTLGSGMTLTGTAGISFGGRGTHTITSAGRQWANGITIASIGGTYTLVDALNTGLALTFNSGTFTTGNNPVTCASFTASASGTRTLNGGTSVFTITGLSGVLWDLNTPMTYNTSGITVIFAPASSSSRQFNGRAATYASLVYNVANSSGTLTLGTACTIGTLDIGPGRTIAFPSSATTTLTTLNPVGVANGYLRLPGVAGNYASTPDSAAVSLTGDMELIAYVAMDSWLPATIQNIITKTAGVPQLGLTFRLQTSGKLYFNGSENGSNVPNQYESASTVPLAAGVGGWVRVVHVQSTGVATFYYSTDPPSTALGSIAWTSLGSSTLNSYAGALFDNTAPVEIGTRISGSAEPMAGKVYRAVMRNGVGGTVVLDADFTVDRFATGAWTNAARTTFAEASSNGATVTINGALAQVGDGRIAITASTGGTRHTLSKSAGVVNARYVTVKDSAAAGGAAWYASTRSGDAGNNTGWVFTDPVIAPTGIASAQAMGAPTVASLATIRPAGIASAGAFGQPAVRSLSAIAAVGIPSAEALGQPAVGSTATIRPTGIASAGAFGQPAVGSPAQVVLVGVPSAEAFGLPTVGSLSAIAAVGIPSAEAFGQPALAARATIRPTGIASAEALGQPALTAAAVVALLGVPSAEAFGLPTVGSLSAIAAVGIPSAEAFGQPALAARATIRPVGVPSAEAFGQPQLRAIARILLTGVPSAEALGQPQVRAIARVSLVGIPSEEAFGQPALTAVARVVLVGISSAEAIGVPGLRSIAFVHLTGIPSEAALGVPRLVRTRGGALAQRLFVVETMQAIFVVEARQSIFVVEPAQISTAEENVQLEEP